MIQDRDELSTWLQQVKARSLSSSQSLSPAKLTEELRDQNVLVKPEDLAWFVSEILDKNRSMSPECNVPEFMLHFITTLVSDLRAETVVDPWPGLGVLATSVASASKAGRVVALGNNREVMELGKIIAPALEWQLSNLGELLDYARKDLTGIDIVASIPPFGLRAKAPIEFKTLNGEVLKVRELGKAMAAFYGSRLSVNGIGIFVLTANALFGQDAIIRQMPLLGLGVEAIVEIPSGSFAPYTQIPTLLVVVRRKLFKDVFVARLSRNGSTNELIASNLRNRINGEVVELGHLLPLEEFHGIDYVRHSQELQAEGERMGSTSVPLSSLSRRITLGRPGDGFQFPPDENAIFLPLIGESEVFVSADQLTLRSQNYAQVCINADLCDARFIAKFLNSDLGRRTRKEGTAGIIPRLNSMSLSALQIYVPPIQVQHQILAISSQIVEEANLLSSLQNELNEMNRSLWNDFRQIPEIESKIEDFSKRMSSEVAPQAMKSLSEWTESLPFPLSSILRAWQASGSDDFKTRQEHLLHFFEASAEFLSVIYLSAFSSRPDIYSLKHKDRLLSAWKSGNVGLERATFGTWKVVVEYFSKQTRLMLSGKEEELDLCKELYVDPSLELPKMLSSKELSSIFATTNTMRNNWQGHGGVASREIARDRNEQLVQQLHRFREVIGDVWTTTKLIRSTSCQFKRGIFDTEISLLMGSNSEFLPERRPMAECLDNEELYLASGANGHALKLLPFVKFGASPPTAKNACYFYNRLDQEGSRFVSYHYEEVHEYRQAKNDDLSLAFQMLLSSD